MGGVVAWFFRVLVALALCLAYVLLFVFWLGMQPVALALCLACCLVISSTSCTYLSIYISLFQKNSSNCDTTTTTNSNSSATLMN
jgi:hypothetical protein